jgi:hypothetical protein
MIRPVAILALTASLVAFGASAAAPGVDQAFGNTIVSTYPDGRTGKLWLKPDGSYTAKGRRGDPSSGHWRVKNAKLCLKQSSPIPTPISFCTAIPSGGMEHAWSAKAVTGEAIRVQLVKGGAESPKA